MALLLREAIGGTIRRARTERRRTLRDVSKDARVSLGYLSEIERGRKEPSSELLAAICDALALSLPDLLDDVADSMRPEAPRPARLADRRLVGVDPALRSAVEEAFGAADTTDAEPAPAVEDGDAAAVTEPAIPSGSADVVDLAGDVAPDAPGLDEEELGGFGDLETPEAPEPAGELRVVELVTLGREPAGVVGGGGVGRQGGGGGGESAHPGPSAPTARRSRSPIRTSGCGPRWNVRPGADTMGQESRSGCPACVDDDELGGSRWPTPS
jgi:transcriptional regulator with XRE-family HTH domain